MRSTGSDGIRPPDQQDRELWRRSQTATTRPDEVEQFLDLAAFVDGGLDEDDDARMASLLARDPAMAADIAAARDLAGATAPVDERIVARAVALVADDDSNSSAEIIAFPPRLQVVFRPWFSAASWSGLAAAILLASWLGFDLGRGFYEFGAVHPSDDVSANELIDPAVQILHDFTGSSQI